MCLEIFFFSALSLTFQNAHEIRFIFTKVISTHEDPIAGWCNNTYGLNGFLVACGFGFIRIMFYSKNTESNIICADFVTNATLAVIWNKANEMER